VTLLHPTRSIAEGQDAQDDLAWEDKNWTLDEAGTVCILRYTGGPTTSAGGTAAQNSAGTWQGLTGTLEALLSQGIPNLGPIDLEGRSVIIAIGDQLQLPITRSRVFLDLGSIPVLVERQAEVLMSGFPWPQLASVMSRIHAWAEAAPVRWFRAYAISDPEESGWEEMVLEAFVDADSETALRIWDHLAAAVDEAKSHMPKSARRLFDKQFGVHIVWPEEHLDSRGFS
jgi:hypothetical protein